MPCINIARETAQFELPDGSFVPSFVAHILHYHPCNVYYAQPYGVGEPTSPDCYSSNGDKPDSSNPIADHCEFCPKNEYGSAIKGGGKACTNQMWFYLLIDGEVLPCVLKAPPSSLGQKGSLMTWLTAAPNVASKAGSGVCYQVVKVEFSLEKKKFSSGTSASVIHLSTVSVLDRENNEDAAQINVLTALYRSLKKTQLLHIQDNLDASLSVGAEDAKPKADPIDLVSPPPATPDPNEQHPDLIPF